MKQFIKKLICFSGIGIIILLILLQTYLYFDPFKVLRHYNDYSYSHILQNRDYISTTMFLNNHQKNNYNSFIFGSSRTVAFRINSWSKYLSDTDNPFMFDASNESIYGIYTKLKYLDSRNVEIKNALIILCRDVSFSDEKNHKGHLFIKHPATSGKGNLGFQVEFFKAYINPKFLFDFYSYQILGTYRPFMFGYIEKKQTAYDSLTNEISVIDREAKIIENPTEYYLQRRALFDEKRDEKRDERTDSTQQITKKQLFILKEIRRILEKHKTTYTVVLSPLYEQIKFNTSDLSLLKNEFGNNLYDFSGKNAFTKDKKNYYETSHFRPNVGDDILKIIYE